MWPGLAYWAAICAVVGAIIYAWLRWDDPLFEPADDPLGDAAHGDYPAIPNDLKVSRFHSERN